MKSTLKKTIGILELESQECGKVSFELMSVDLVLLDEKVSFEIR